MNKFTFVKNEDNRWYVVLPDYIDQGGHREDLEMVAGADTMLDELSNYGNRVTLIISTEEPVEKANFHKLTRIEENELGSGSFYNTDGSLNVELIWLCDVMLYVFDDFPEVLYYAKTTTL